MHDEKHHRRASDDATCPPAQLLVMPQLSKYMSRQDHEALLRVLVKHMPSGILFYPQAFSLPEGWSTYRVRLLFPAWSILRGAVWPPLLVGAIKKQYAARPCLLIMDELFGTPMIHAAHAKWFHRATVFAYCCENIPFPPLMRFSAWLFSRFVDVALCSCKDAELRAREAGVRRTVICPCPVWEPETAAVKELSRIRTVGFVGRLIPEKGIAEIIEAAVQLPDLEFRLYGNGPLLDTVRQAPAVRYMGSFAGREGAEQAYRELDVLLLPSRTTPRWKEQYGRVLAEAMGRGIIPLGSNSGSIPEVIGDSRLIFPEGDAAALAERLRWLAGLSPDAVAALSRSVRQRFVEALGAEAFGRAWNRARQMVEMPKEAR